MAVKNLGFKRSPNHRVGRSGWEKKANIIVHHVTEGAFNGAVSWLCNPQSQASSHFVTSQDGQFIQLVELNNMSWCNGNNAASIREALNETVKSRPSVNANLYTFTIENEGWSYQKNFGIPTADQREAIKEVHKKIVDHILSYNPSWRASKENVIGHCHIRSVAKPSCPSPNKGEKFPWDELINDINTYIDSKQGTKTPTVEITSPDIVAEIKVPDKPDYSSWPGINKHNGMKGHQIPFVLEIAPAVQASMGKGILNSIRLAQAILESGWGTSNLAKNARNLFGIKADTRWKGATFNIKTGEWSPSQGHFTIDADFRAYDSMGESIIDHTDFLLANSRYKALINDKDYKSVANKLKAAGYATDPNYPSKLIAVIESNDLTWFDNLKPTTVDSISVKAPVINLPTDTVTAAHIKVGTMVKIRKGATTYDGKTPASFVYDNAYPVSDYSGDRVVLDRGGINTPYNVIDLIVVSGGIEKPKEFVVGSLVKINSGAKWMVTPEKDVPAWALSSVYRIDKLEGNKAILNTDGINSPIDIKYLTIT